MQTQSSLPLQLSLLPPPVAFLIKSLILAAGYDISGGPRVTRLYAY